MYTTNPSDYGYASSGCRNGVYTLMEYDNAACTSTNWLFNNIWFWELNLSIEDSKRVHSVYLDGGVDHSNAYNKLK